MRGSIDQLLNVSATDAERLSDIRRHFVDKIGKSNVTGSEIDLRVKVLVDMLKDGTLLFCDHTGGLEKTFQLPKECYVMRKTGLRRLENGMFHNKEILLSDRIVYSTPWRHDWCYHFTGGALIMDIQLTRPLDARITDAQYREVLRQWCRRIKKDDALCVLAHLMDTQQFEAANVMVQIHYF